MPVGIETNEVRAWFDSIHQSVCSKYTPNCQSIFLFSEISKGLLDLDAPSAFQTTEGLSKLKAIVEDRDPEAAQSIEGLVDDLAARILGKPGAELALAIRKGDIEEVLECYGLPESPEAYQRLWRAVLEGPSKKIFAELQSFLFPVQAEKLASVINLSETPLVVLSNLLGPQADEVLLELAPHLSFADFQGLDGSLQKELLEKCCPPKLNYLLIDSSKITALPSGMVALEYLGCCRCKRLEKLPPDMSSLRTLDCMYCDSLTTLPDDMAALNTLNCWKSKKLNKLPNGMARLQKLNCSGCKMLTSLPSGMTSIQSIWCSYCPNLENLPTDLAALRRLDCENCDRLASLPEGMTSLQYLSCQKCASLVKLPDDMAALQKLDCWECKSLLHLPKGMTALEFLQCPHCESLASLPDDMSALRQLLCSGCSDLFRLPIALPNCTYLNFTECPLLVDTPTPEVPANATVYRSLGDNWHSDHDCWQVPYDEVPLDPKAFLCQLGEVWLLEGLPFPSVAYRERNGQPFKGVDIGGVRRDLVSRVLIHLFHSELGKEKALFRSPEMFPVWQNEDESQLSAYRSLARLMALSYQHVCNLTTGPLFSERLYQALLTEPDSLDRAAALMGLDDELVALAKGEKAPDANVSPDLKEKVLHYLNLSEKRFTHGELEDNLQAALDYLKAQPLSLKDGILDEMNFSKGQYIQINRAVDWIRTELQLALGPDTWKKIQKKGAAKLQKEIEGELSVEALWGHLQWNTGKSTKEEVQKSKGYLQNWIEKASKQSLEDFVRAVSGNRSLNPKHLSVELYRRGPEWLPQAHSCCSTLELSSQLPDQKTFDKKMKQFLKNALAGSGFQFA